MNKNERLQHKTGYSLEVWKTWSPDKIYQAIERYKKQSPMRRSDENAFVKALPEYAQEWWHHWHFFHQYNKESHKKFFLEESQYKGWAMLCYVKGMHLRKSFRLSQEVVRKMAEYIIETVNSLDMTMVLILKEDCGYYQNDLCLRLAPKIIANHESIPDAISTWGLRILNCAETPIRFHRDNLWYTPDTFQHPMLYSTEKEPSNILYYLQTIAEKRYPSSFLETDAIWKWVVEHYDALSPNEQRYYTLSVPLVLKSHQNRDYKYAPYCLTLTSDPSALSKYNLSQEWQAKIKKWYTEMAPLMPMEQYSGMELYRWECAQEAYHMPEEPTLIL